MKLISYYVKNEKFCLEIRYPEPLTRSDIVLITKRYMQAHKLKSLPNTGQVTITLPSATLQ